jgi:hypothetical protein
MVADAAPKTDHAAHSAPAHAAHLLNTQVRPAVVPSKYSVFRFSDDAHFSRFKHKQCFNAQIISLLERRLVH